MAGENPLELCNQVTALEDDAAIAELADDEDDYAAMCCLVGDDDDRDTLPDEDMSGDSAVSILPHSPGVVWLDDSTEDSDLEACIRGDMDFEYEPMPLWLQAWMMAHDPMDDEDDLASTVSTSCSSCAVDTAEDIDRALIMSDSEIDDEWTLRAQYPLF